MIRLYFVTSPEISQRVLSEGFDDAIEPKRPGVVRNDGVWLMSFPSIFDWDKWVCMAVDIALPVDRVEEWHWHDQGTVCEWYLVPAAELNAHAQTVILTPDELALVIREFWYGQKPPSVEFQA